MATLIKQDEAILFQSVAKGKKKEQRANRASVSKDEGHAILFIIVHYKKAQAMASTNVCLFIKLSNNPQNRFELLSGNQNLSSQK